MTHAPVVVGKNINTVVEGMFREERNIRA